MASPAGHPQAPAPPRPAAPGADSPGRAAGRTREPFRLTSEQVRRAASAARLQARAAGRPLDGDDLRAGARAQNAAGLERLARRMEPAVSFDDLVLPADVAGQLRDLTVRARHREL